MANPAKRADPYPLYEILQQCGPVYYPPLRAWFLTRHADVIAALRHAGISSMRSVPGLRGLDAPADSQRLFARTEELFMINRDPPDHTRLRRLVSRAFSGAALAGIDDLVRRTAAELIGPHQKSGRMDLLRDYAYPLPLLIISGMLGVPAEDRLLFSRWASELGSRFGVSPQRTPAERRVGERAMGELTAYLTQLAEARRRHPRNDLMSDLVAIVDEDDRLSNEELVANAALLLNAGHETTANLIANGVLALLSHPVQLERFTKDDTLERSGTEELLRFDTSVQLTPRLLLSELTLGSTVIPAGSRLFLMLGACNRDPEQFPDPHTLDLERPSNHHLSFGWGVHHCLGASLARIEIATGIRVLLASCADIALASPDVTWRKHFSLRGLDSLEVRWSLA